jgi:hypothetical protein
MVDLTPQAIFQAALRMAEEDRLELAMDLLDSLPEDDNMLSPDDPQLVAHMDRGIGEQDAISAG